MGLKFFRHRKQRPRLVRGFVAVLVAVQGPATPVVYSWPGKIKPSVSDALVSSVDVVPTILAAAGDAQPKEPLPGANLLPVMEGKANLDDRAVFGETFARDAADLDNPESVLLNRWVIHKRYKLIVACGAAAGEATEPELYDLLDDPFEQKNLYGTRPEVYESLRSRLEAWRPINK